MCCALHWSILVSSIQFDKTTLYMLRPKPGRPFIKCSTAGLFKKHAWNASWRAKAAVCWLCVAGVLDELKLQSAGCVQQGS